MLRETKKGFTGVDGTGSESSRWCRAREDISPFLHGYLSIAGFLKREYLRLMNDPGSSELASQGGATALVPIIRKTNKLAAFDWEPEIEKRNFLFEIQGNM